MISILRATAFTLSICSVGFAAESAMAGQKHALLIGVTEYSRSIASFVPSLAGPGNDVALLYDTLVEKWGGDARISVLANGLDRAGGALWERRPESPTRAAILAAFDRLAREAVEGDEVLIYMSGHGSQIPTLPGADADEPDGLDEIFLPADFAISNDSATGTVTIRNHIRDNEIGVAVDRLVARGVFVWLVVDACHSGTMERNSFGAARARYATTLVAGTRRVVDLNASTEAVAVESSGGGARDEASIEVGSPRSGGFVGFYAALPSQRAWEYPLPKDAPAALQRQHGLLTWSLVEALRRREASSYGDLARTVNAAFWEWGNGAPQPLFVGDFGRAPMTGEAGERTWTITTRGRALYLRGGRLDGVVEGAVLAVTSGSRPDAEPVFHARVVESALEEARLEIVTDDPSRPNGVPDAARRDGLSGSARDRWLWLEDRAEGFRARLVERPIAFTLRVARPASVAGAVAEGQRRLVDQLLLDLDDAPESEAALAIDVVDAEDGADLRLAIRDGRLWFTPDLGSIVTTGPRQAYSQAIEGLTTERLSQALRQIARARNFFRVAAAFAETETARSLRVEVAVEERAPEPATGICARHPDEEPPSAPASARVVNGFDLRPAGTVSVGHCDRVYLTLRNDGATALDVSPFYLSPHSDLFFLRGYRDAKYFGLRIEPGQTRTVSYTEDTATTAAGPTPVGDMRLVLIVTEAEPGSAYPSDFRHLEGFAPPTRRAAPHTFGGLLDEAGFGGGTVRAAAVGGDVGRAGAIIIAMETFAPEDE